MINNFKQGNGQHCSSVNYVNIHNHDEGNNIIGVKELMNTPVVLKDGIFKASQEKGKEYLLFLDVDRLIAPCYEAVKQQPKKPRYGGWESTQIAGHSIGHWLSAAAAMYEATQDQSLKEKIIYALDELEHVQSFDKEGYLAGFPRDCFDQVFSGEFEVGLFNLGNSWVPWYSIHKIYAGLIDVYNILGLQKALDIVVKLADWAKNGLDNLTDEQFQRMLICEHGGMNEAMADLYLITKNEDYLELAKRFCHDAILNPLAEGKDDLEGKHANTQIPKVIGAAKLYNITGEKRYQDMALYFWDQVIKHRSYVTGGNSIREHFGPVNDEELGIQTTETCNTYNMMKLTELLYQWSPDAAYMDYYERALYNHILPSQDPDSGMKSYFIPTQPGHFKIYCSPEDSFWCCTGTGMENPARYNRNIYYQHQDDLYVNLFIASELIDKEKGIQLIQQTDFPSSDETTLLFKKAGHEAFTLHIRVPYWIASEVTVTVNDEEVYTQKEGGYLSIKRNWADGDQVVVKLPMNLHKYIAKDDPHKQAFLYGPVVLAGKLGRENYPETDILEDHMKLDNHPLIDVPTLVANEDDPNDWIKQVSHHPLVFETDPLGQPGNQSITLVPFYDLHHERYALYWNVMTEKDYENFTDEKQEAMKRHREITIDEVFPNEQQPEVEHNLQTKNSYAGYLNVVQRGWRDSRGDGFFSYDMKVEPDRQMYLCVTYYGSDHTLYFDGKSYVRDFEILVDGTVIATQKLAVNKPGSLFEVCYEIPEALTKDKEKVEVKFKSEEGKAAGGVYGVRITNEKV